MLGKESNSLLACLDLGKQLEDISALADVVGLSGLDRQVSALIFFALDEAFECSIIVTDFIVLRSLFHFFHLLLEVSFLLVHFHFLVNALWLVLAASERRQLRGIDHSRRSFALDTISTYSRCTRPLNWLLV